MKPFWNPLARSNLSLDLGTGILRIPVRNSVLEIKKHASEIKATGEVLFETSLGGLLAFIELIMLCFTVEYILRVASFVLENIYSLTYFYSNNEVGLKT